DESVENAAVALVKLNLAADLEARETAHLEPAAIVERDGMGFVALAHQKLGVLLAIEVVRCNRVNRELIRSGRGDVAVLRTQHVTATAGAGLIDGSRAERHPAA